MNTRKSVGLWNLTLKIVFWIFQWNAFYLFITQSSWDWKPLKHFKTMNWQGKSQFVFFKSGKCTKRFLQQFGDFWKLYAKKIIQVKQYSSILQQLFWSIRFFITSQSYNILWERTPYLHPLTYLILVLYF